MSIEQLEREVLAWRAARVARLTAPDGWLSLVGKDWLAQGSQRIGSAPDAAVMLPAGKAPEQFGELELSQGVVRFTPARAGQARIQRAGSQQTEPVTGTIELATDARGPADRLWSGEIAIEIMERSGTFAARVRDRESSARLQFPGIEYYPIRAEWRVRARLERYTPERSLKLLYETGAEQPYVVPGAAVFEVDGVEYRIDPVFEGGRARLFVLFADATNRTETYGAGRFLYAPWPQHHGDEVILDFNQAFSPPCAFTPYAVCPLPPAQNRLPLAIEAGEKRPVAQY
jgi:uncharacterized protein (DUF1684 family)